MLVVCRAILSIPRLHQIIGSIVGRTDLLVVRIDVYKTPLCIASEGDAQARCMWDASPTQKSRRDHPAPAIFPTCFPLVTTMLSEYRQIHFPVALELSQVLAKFLCVVCDLIKGDNYSDRRPTETATPEQIRSYP